MAGKISKTDAEWKAELSPDQYQVMRQRGTEPAFTGEYWNSKTAGVYHCAGCGAALFDAEAKYDSGTGWPSFTQPMDEGRVLKVTDVSHGMRRTEVVCAHCEGHLGHVFEDGPRPTGLRYCMNSAALRLAPRDKEKS